jgi:mono/diheme cytochrome c family protein
MKLGFVLAVPVFVGLCSTPMRANDAAGASKAPSPVSGREMYTSYCASCHGRDGKGDGPAAPALKTPPADLTMLSAHNNGQFPEMRVYGAIRGDVKVTSHGSAEMPVWGQIFRKMGDSAEAQMRVANLVSYLKSIQSK